MRVLLLGAASGLAACGPSPVINLPEDRLPREAAQAFIRYASDLGEGELRCSVMAVTHAPRAEIDINADGRTDFAIDTRQLGCSAPSGTASSAYFCGSFTCSYPVIVSGEGGWRVIPMMSGNAIEAVEHYTEARFRVRQLNRTTASAPSNILVRDYAWREGELARVYETIEIPERLAGR